MAFLYTFALVALSAATASAHMTVQPKTVPDEGSYYRVAMRVPHGCRVGEGDDAVYYPTHTIQTIVPKEIAMYGTARAEWVPFWPAVIEDMDDGARKITWMADSEDSRLGDDVFAEFGITMKVPAMGSPEAPAEGYFGFPSIQFCDGGNTAEWLGEDTPKLTYETMADEYGHGAMAGAGAAHGASAGQCCCDCAAGESMGNYGR